MSNIAKKFSSFLYQYGSYYDEDDLEYIKSHFMDYLNEEEAVCLLEQVKYAIGEMSNNSIYINYFNFLKEHFNLSQDILEVACGCFPVLASLIDKHQKKVGMGGSIEAMDPFLVTYRHGTIKLRREYFTRDTNLGKFSLVTAYYPCEASMDLVKACGEQDKDYSIAICGCIHDEDYLPYISYYGMYPGNPYKDWAKKLYKAAKESLRGNRTLDIEYIDGIDTPIFLSKKKH